MRTGVFVFAALLGSFFMLSCNEDNEEPQSAGPMFTATMNGRSEVPANGSGATGTATLTFNPKTKTLHGKMTYTGLTINGANIRKGAPGDSGVVVFSHAGALISPITFKSTSLTPEQEADLNAGLYYVNLQTEAYPKGEIRGQLIRDEQKVN